MVEMLADRDLETLSRMVKSQLEKLILSRSSKKKSNEAKHSLDEEIDDLYELLAKLIISKNGNISRNSRASEAPNNSTLNELQSILERVEFIESLRKYWSRLTNTVNAAIQYTYDENSSQERYDEICILLGQAIDELRSFYTNIKEHPEEHGLYPFEPIKGILHTIQKLGFGQLDQTRRDDARIKIKEYWESMREDFLSEFDRAEPKKPVSHYLEAFRRK